MRHVELAAGVHRFGDSIVNWYVLEEGADLTVIDTAWPRSWPEIESSLAEIGHGPGDIRAILLSHGHADHMGSAEQARRVSGAPVRAHHLETPRITGEKIGASPFAMLPSLLPHMWRPAAVGFAVHSLRRGFFTPRWVTSLLGFSDGERLDVPGGPLPVLTPGHTAGHCGFHLADKGVLFTGDALATYDPLSGRSGPRLLPPAMNDDHLLARRSLERFEGVDATLVCPGHGEHWIGDSPGQAVAVALEREGL